MNKKSMFVPRSTADFDDGGSFPEIHVSVFFICTTYYIILYCIVKMVCIIYIMIYILTVIISILFILFLYCINN